MKEYDKPYRYWETTHYELPKRRACLGRSTACKGSVRGLKQDRLCSDCRALNYYSQNPGSKINPEVHHRDRVKNAKA